MCKVTRAAHGGECVLSHRSKVPERRTVKTWTHPTACNNATHSLD